jgi:four helix bundle protein
MGEAIRTHKDLEVWKEAMQLARDVYTWSQNLPREEIYGLVTQIRRAAISIPSNIAEGAARGSRREFRQFLYVALGSLAELETQIFLAKELFGLDDGGPFGTSGGPATVATRAHTEPRARKGGQPWLTSPTPFTHHASPITYFPGLCPEGPGEGVRGGDAFGAGQARLRGEGTSALELLRHRLFPNPG